MSIISEALKKSDIGKQEKQTQKELRPRPRPHLDVPDMASRPPFRERHADLLPDWKLEVPEFLLRWARATRPWMIWTGMVVSLIFATVLYEWKTQVEKKAAQPGQQSVASSVPLKRASQQVPSRSLGMGRTSGRSLLDPPVPKQDVPLFGRKKVSDFYLTGISGGGGGKIALINNKLVREGDLVDGARVISIQPQEVVLERRGERLSRTLY